MRDTFETVSEVVVYHTRESLFCAVEAAVVFFKLLYNVRSGHYLSIGALVGVTYFLEYLSE